MSDRPILVIMAAGMGSRYGGLKQLDPVDEAGHIIMDFSVYDAVRAGFGKVVFIIKEEHETDFRNKIISRLEPFARERGIELALAFQKLDTLPVPVEIPEGRVKPWGTAHAVYCAKDEIDAPFAVINADDYYGPTGFQELAGFLAEQSIGERADASADKAHYAMVGFELAKTVTDNGYVSRGVCEVDDSGYLISVTERVRVEKHGDGIAFTEDEGETWHDLPVDARVSMNLWGFTEDFVECLSEGVAHFLTDSMPSNPLKSECYLPFVVSDLLAQGLADVQVLPTPDKWYGVTYKEDKPQVEAAIAQFKKDGLYPERLFEQH